LLLKKKKEKQPLLEIKRLDKRVGIIKRSSLNLIMLTVNPEGNTMGIPWEAVKRSNKFIKKKTIVIYFILLLPRLNFIFLYNSYKILFISPVTT